MPRETRHQRVTEPDLMELLGVSRNSVREALKALRAMGIVEVRRGVGTYVGAMSMAPTVEGLAFRTVAAHHRGEDSLLQFSEPREAVETGLVARLAGRADADLAELDALVGRMEKGAAATDRAFHATLHRSLSNPPLIEVTEAFREAFHRVRTDLVDVPQDPEVTSRQYCEILDAVRSGDVGRAERAIREHFGNIRL
ncbi:FCD domain-containing protein [Streptomyces sp. Q6]|uniref:FCD domain-containing protein n=1 Tax=Streptomyces citrinus TaxID=3118173 RepID=A0ACD5AP53_9ACTN